MTDPEPTLREFVAEFDRRLAALLPKADADSDLMEALSYSVLAPGKRVRPYLLIRSCQLAGGSSDQAWPAAAAVECVHAFSLVHDDLPAMDNDDVRRGRPTTHRQFGEAAAILAGDALVVLAFELLAAHYADHPQGCAIILELAQAAGWSGMIGGQAADLAAERQAPSLQSTQAIHGRKTARLFAAACKIGGLVGRGPARHVQHLGDFGFRLGEAFQIADDILDVIGSPDELGKTPGKDRAAGKQTYPACIGLDASRRAAGEKVAAAQAELLVFGPAADDLRSLAAYIATRNY